MKTPTRHTPFAAYLILVLLFSGLLLSSCDREEKTCVEKDRSYLDTPVIKLLDYENNLFNIYNENDTLLLKESSTGIIHTFISKPVNTFYRSHTIDYPDVECKRYEKFENKQVVFYNIKDDSELSITVWRELRSYSSGFYYFTIFFKNFSFYDYSGRFLMEDDITYKEYEVEGIIYKDVYKFISDTQRDSTFNDYYALYTKNEGVLEIKFPGGNTFSRVP
jgi:hypothetical protein